MAILRWILLSIAAVSIAGCASFWTPQNARTRNSESYPLPVWTADGLYLASGRAGALFLSPAPLDPQRYRGIYVEDIEISTRNRSRELRPAEESRLRDYFMRRLTYAFESNGWQIVGEPSNDVLRVRLAVRDVHLERWRHPHAGKVISGVSSAKVAIILEIRDAVDGNRRLLFGDKRRLPIGGYSGTDAVSIRRLEDAFYYFSIDLRRRIDEVQRGSFPPPPASQFTSDDLLPGWRHTDRISKPPARALLRGILSNDV